MKFHISGVRPSPIFAHYVRVHCSLIAGASEFFSLSFTVSFAAYTFMYLVLLFLASSAQIWSWLTNFPPCFPRSRGFTLDRLTGEPFVSARGRTHFDWSFRDCVVTVCFVYSLRFVVVILDYVVYNVFVWFTVYVLSLSHSIVWCTVCLFGVPFTFCRAHTWRWSALYVCLVYHLRSVVVTLDGVVYNMFVWCTVYVLSWSHLTV